MKKFVLLAILSVFIVVSGISQTANTKSGTPTTQKVEKEPGKKVDKPNEADSSLKTVNSLKGTKPEFETQLLKGGSLLLIEFKDAKTICEMEADSLDTEILNLL